MNQLLENDLAKDLKENLEKEQIEVKQNNFFGNLLGKTINTAIDTGLRIVLPNAVEDTVINIKDVLFKEGLGEGLKSAVSSAINLGKSAIGIVTGKFEDVSQAYNAIKKGGIIDSTSKLIDNALKSANKNGLVNDSTAKIIKKGKNVIKECVSSKIEQTFMEQVNSVEKIGKYIENWNSYLNRKDVEGMNREYRKIQEKLDNIMPIEKTLKDVEKISNIQTLIKNKGGIDKLTEEEIELAKKLI